MLKSKTTLNIDEQTYYFLYQIGLIELERENIFFTSINFIIKHCIEKLHELHTEDNFPINNMDIQHVIREKNKTVIYLTLKDEYIHFIEDIKISLEKQNDILLFYNQIVKMMVVYYYNHLLAKN